MVWIGALLGLRWSEVAGLRMGRLDLLRRTLAVAEAVTRDQHGEPVFTPPKSIAGVRTLMMPSQLAEMRARHIASLGATAADAEALVFQAPEGGPLRYANWRRRVWMPATIEACCVGAGFHDLRRTNATGLVLARVDLKTAQARLGHSDPRLTLAVYAQAATEADMAAAEALARHFSRPSRDGRGMERASG
jgi:integrase